MTPATPKTISLRLRKVGKKVALILIGALFVNLVFPYAARMQSEQEPVKVIEPQEESPQSLIGSNAGDFDPTFAGAGKVSLNLYSANNDYSQAAVRQSDGKVIVVGDTNNYPCLVRYNTDGSLDQTFGNTYYSAFTPRGVACSPATVGTAGFNDVLVQPDGKIVAIGVGNSSGGDRYTIVARFNSDGSADTTFSGDGFLPYSQNGGDDWSIAGAIQSDGKIVVAGKVNDVTAGVVRINSDGSVDTTFNGGGAANFNCTGYSRCFAASVAIDSSGRIVIGGYGLGSNNDYIFARITSAGAMDSTFVGGSGTIAAGTGIVAVQISASDDTLSGMLLQPDGKIVGAGYSNTSTPDFSAVRLNTNGSLDTSFDVDGKLLTNFGLNDRGNGVAIQPDGKIVIAGESDLSGSRYDFALARYNIDGSLDASFDGDGKLTTQFNANNSVARDVLLAPDGKIVVAGRSNWASVDFSVARYNPNGSLDLSWGRAQAIDFNINDPLKDDLAESVAQQADGKLVTVGRSSTSSLNRFALTRHNADGTLDTGFGTGGKVAIALVNSDYGESVAVQPVDQKIVVGGFTYNGSGDYDFLIARYNTNGSLDTSFGTSGFARKHNSSDDNIQAIALLPDGDIVGVGYTVGGNIDIAVLRFDVTTNTWDPAFGTGGLKTIANAGSDVAYDVKIDSNGKILVGGLTTPSSRDFILARLNANDGTNDATFNGGNVLVQQVNGLDEEIHALTLQPDGKIIVAGYANTGANGNDFIVERLTTSGAPDATFDFDGKQVTTFSSSNDVANGVAIQADGKVLLSGYAGSGIYNDYAFARYNSDGSLDTSFGTGGRRTYDSSGYHDYATGNLIIQSDGKAVTVGESHNGINWDFGIVRILTTSAVDCGYNLSSSSQNVPQAGSSYSINVTTTGQCNRTAVSNVPWINFTGNTNGTGNGTVAYSVTANPNAVSRMGTVTIGGQTLTVLQYGSNMAVSVPTGMTGQNGAGLTVPISVNDTTGQGILSYDFTFTYDQSVITPQATPFDRTGTLSSGFTVTVNATTPGVLVVSGFGTSVLSGAGTLLNLKFDVVGLYPNCSNLNFTAFEFNTGNPPNQTTNGQVCAVNGNISGIVTYVNGSPTQPAVQNTTVTAVGSTTLSTSTDSTGYYYLSPFSSGAYTVTPSKSGDVNGITAMDAALVAQHVVGLITLSSTQQIAGDTSNNAALNSFDAALIAQYAIAIPNPLSIAGTWKFSPASRNYASVVTDTPNQNYSAILVGEVSGNWTAPAPFAELFKLPEVFTTEPVDVRFPSIYGASGSTVTVPINVGKELSSYGVLAYQLDFSYDPTVLQPDVTFTSQTGTISDGLTVTVNNSTSGRTRIAVFGTAALNGQGRLINLRFNVIGAPGQVSPLNWTTFLFNEGNPNSTAGNGQVTILSPTAANVSVAGRVQSANGSGIRNVVVTLIDSNGETHTARTSAFGYYRFDEIPVGVIVVSVAAKRYTFANPTQAINVGENIADLDFTSIE